MAQHAELTEERWRGFPLERQILMIANELHRASRLLAEGDRGGVERCYERVLRLLDLTVAVHDRPALRRELLRWRDLIAEQFVSAVPSVAAHRAALRALLLLDPVAARQIPFVAAEPILPAGG